MNIYMPLSKKIYLENEKYERLKSVSWEKQKENHQDILHLFVENRGKNNLPRQPPWVQAFVSLAGPRPSWIQLSCPEDGGGFIQALVLNWFPTPHETEHAPHWVHKVYPAGTIVNKYKLLITMQTTVIDLHKH